MADRFGSKRSGQKRHGESVTQGHPLWVSSWKKGNPKTHPGSGTASHRQAADPANRSRVAMLLAGEPTDDEIACHDGVPTRLTAFSRRASTADVLQRESDVMTMLRQYVRQAARQAQSTFDLAEQRRRFRRRTPWVQTIGRICGLGLLWGVANSVGL